ncbi:MAG: diguanylate cyclase, partial [Dokdonella sp.]
ELWELSYGGGIARIRPDGIKVWRSASGELPSEATYSAQATYTAQGERVLWVASRAGLLQIRGDTVRTFDRRHGLPSDAIRGLKLQRSVDGTDVLWLATEGGIARAALTDSQWQTVSLLGASENGIFGVLLEPDGHGGEQLWVGTSKKGVGLLQDSKWRYFNRASGTLPSDGVRGIWRVTGPDGSIWRILGLTGGALLRVDDELRFSSIPAPWPMHDEAAASNVIARQYEGANELWFATLHDGVYRLRGGQWTRFALDENKSVWSVLRLVEQIDASGRSWLWAASNKGLARFDGEAWHALPAEGGLPVDGYRGITIINEGERTIMWASSDRHGVVRVDVTDPQSPKIVSNDGIPPPPDPSVYSVLQDSQKRIYICTNNGVQQLTPTADGSYHQRVFRRRDGIVHDECNTNAQFIDAQDRYWVGTLGGLSVFDPGIRAATSSSRPKPLYFTEARIDGKTQELEQGRGLDLPSGTRELRVDFALLTGMRESESTYRSELVGFDPAASDWSSDHSRSFTSLPPGHYELKVDSRDYAGTASTPAILAIEVEPYWWQRAWVRPMSVVLLILIGIGIVLEYNRNLRARQRQLKLEVATRTTELHDANLRLTELSYLDPLTGVANRRRLTNAIDAAIDRARARSLPVGLIVIDVDHFKRYNDAHGHLAGDAALRAVAQALASATREQDLVARFGGEEFACLMIDTDTDTVARIAERMRALVEALPPRALGNDTQTITLSAGVVNRVPAVGEHADDLLAEADTAMYRAKREGRNCVRRADQTA